jgi:hypothetical protein
MNKQLKQHLEAVVTAIINEDAAAAKDAFHSYLSIKTQHILVGEAECDDEECPMNDDESDEKKDEDDKSDDKKEDKGEKADKADKKDKKDDKKDDDKEDDKE